MVTENEAREKWCPFTRGDVIAAERLVTGALNNARCIGSNCMAWRWEIERNPDGIIGPIPSERFNVKSGRGFCGLAGRPDDAA